MSACATLTATAVAALALAGCGYVGPPLPPALDIPSRIIDLRVIEYGDKIVAEFTIPPLTTEGLPLKSVRSVELRVNDKTITVSATGPGPVHHEVPAQQWIGQDANIVVRATGPKGHASEWSNPKTLPIRPPLAKPANVKAANVEKGIALTWTSPPGHFHIFRAIADQDPTPLADADQPEYLDTTVEYGTAYRYYVQSVAGELQQSEVSDAAPVTPKDTFAPAIPSGVTAIAGVNTIELAWERNTEPDFKGYNIYRSVEGAPFERIAESIEAPAFTDRKVEAGKKYRYAITAVDLRGNESDRSSIQEATAQ